MNHIDVVAAEDDVGHCLGIQMEWWCGVSLSYSNVRCIFNVNQYCKGIECKKYSYFILWLWSFDVCVCVFYESVAVRFILHIYNIYMHTATTKLLDRVISPMDWDQ